MFFDAISRGESFDYEAFLEDVRSRPLDRGTSSRRIPNTRGEFENPVYGESESFAMNRPPPYD